MNRRAAVVVRLGGRGSGGGEESGAPLSGWGERRGRAPGQWRVLVRAAQSPVFRNK
jgi:hypothetical protein